MEERKIKIKNKKNILLSRLKKKRKDKYKKNIDRSLIQIIEKVNNNIKILLKIF